MKDLYSIAGLGFGIAFGLGASVASQAQVTITASDMFNQAGQYYRAYGNDPNDTSISVGGMLGSTGGPQLWDFTGGPTGATYRFDYLSAASTPHGANFATLGAQLAEQKTDESGVQEKAWLYFTQHPTLGRRVYGFYDPSFSAGIGADQPEEVFSTPLNDFPATIQYGAAWSSSTIFSNTITFGDPEDPESSFTMDLIIGYSSSCVADAYGIANSPGIGFGDCLRVNELVTYDISGDFNDGSGPMHLETDYVRNFYWLRPGRGVVAQVTSQQSSSMPPGNNFLTASAVLRMFQTNHPDSGGSNTNNGIQGLKVTMGPSGALIQWTPLATVSQYRVEYSATPAGGWQTLGNLTTGNFMIDPAAGKPATPKRFYRVVGLP